MYYIGFDIGGSSVKAVLAKTVQQAHRRKIIKLEVKDLPASLDSLLNLIGQIFDEFTLGIERNELGGVGVSAAGVMDLAREKMLNSPNIGYLNNQPLKKILAEKLDCHVKLEHDVHCFLLAEKELGLAKDLQNVFYLTLGTGIGAAWMTDGKIHSGVHGAAGEAGHMIIEIDRNMNLEEVASNKFINKVLGVGSIRALEMARAGDKDAIEVFRQLGKNLGVGIANIINIFDPEAVILAGGISEARDFLLPEIEERVEKFVVSPEAKKTKILFSQLGRFGGALGATLLF